MRLLVTRPQPQADAWVARLAAQGIEAVALPLIDIAGPPDPAAVAAAWRSLPARALAMFVSPSAVERFFAARPEGVGWPALLEAGATGPGTSQALADAGVARIVQPPADAGKFDSEALWPLLRARRDWHGASVLVVRGDGGRDWLSTQLREAGATVDPVAAYARRAPQWDDATRLHLDTALALPSTHCWLFGSSEAIDHLARLVPEGTEWRHACALATHPRIAERARRLGIGRVLEVSAGFDSVVAALPRPPSPTPLNRIDSP